MPNPTKGSFVVDMPSAQGRKASMVIHDLFGRVMLESDYTMGDAIDLTSYASGMYMVYLVLDGEFNSMKLLVQ